MKPRGREPARSPADRHAGTYGQDGDPAAARSGNTAGRGSSYPYAAGEPSDALPQ